VTYEQLLAIVSAHLSALASLVAVVGLPLAVAAFWQAKRREQLDREYGTCTCVGSECLRTGSGTPLADCAVAARLASLILALALAGCGAKGDLVRPEPAAPAGAPAAPAKDTGSR
jgi:predicted small lipoprotein YifL